MADTTEVISRLIGPLASVDLESFSQECMEVKLIPQSVKKSIASISLESELSLRPRKIRYILLHTYERLQGNARLHERWVEVLAKFGVSLEPPYGEKSRFFTKKHISALVEILAGNSSRWYNIGISFNLPVNTLREIATLMHSQGGSGPFIYCLTQVLTEWVSRNHEQAEYPTVENLRKALFSDTVELADVASHLQESLMERGVHFVPNRVTPVLPVQAHPGVPLLEIVRQSFDVEIAEEKSTLLEVYAIATDNATICYQWIKDECPLEEDGWYFIGATKPILCVNDVIMASKGTYKCEVQILIESGEAVVVQSEPMVLTVDYVPTTKVLVEMYSSSLREIQKNSWPPLSNKVYVDLALIKHIEVDIGELATIKGAMDESEKEKVEYEVVFGKYKSGSLILIEGRPGSGKTTLVSKITKDWATGKFILKGAKLVLLISLRGLSKRVDASMMDILRSVYHTNDTICSALLAQLEKCYGDGVCLILDGLDEYSRDEKYESTIFDIIQRRYLQQSMVIVSSRHVASSELREKASVCIEVVGFLKEQILEYVHHYPFTSKYVSAEDLETYLVEHPNILHMCYLPVHASMISFLYSKMKDDLPETASGIYKYFTLFTLLRKLKGVGKLKSLDDLSGRSLDQFKKICRLAFEMTTCSQQVFEANELSTADSTIEASLGLVTVDISYGTFGVENMYSFFHLTFQEFLAAYYLSMLEEPEQMDMINRYGKTKQMVVVWKFFCGLVNFDDRDFKFREILKLHNDDLFRCQCAFESQQPSMCTSVVLFEESGSLSFRKQALNPSDLSSIGYVVSNATSILGELTLHKCNISSTESILALSQVLKRATSLLSLDISGNNVGDDGITILARRFVRYKCLQKLNLTENRISEVGAEAIASGLESCKTLELLNLEANAIGDKGVHIIHDIIVRQFNTLKWLNLAFNRIGDACVVPISEILGHCRNLLSFHVGGNDFSSFGVDNLVQSFKACDSLQQLNLDWTKMRDSGAKILSDCLKNSGTLQFLSLKDVDVFDVGMISISDCLRQCLHLQEVYLTMCNVSDAGAKALASGLNHPSSLTRVDLSWNRIGDEGAEALARTLTAYQHLKKLDLSENRIGNDGISCIAENLALTVVYFYGNCICTGAALAIADSLKSHCEVETLDLSNCGLTDESVTALASGLAYCFNLVTLDLHQNCIKDAGAEALAKVLCACSRLKSLDLAYNALGDLGANAIAECLTHNINLEDLHLGHNQISDTGAISLAENLKGCKNLRSLTLPNNEIGQEGADDLARSLKRCKFLKHFDLAGNKVTSGDTAKVLTKIVNSDTIIVNLAGNKMGKNGIKKLCESLKHRSHLQKLTLDRNDIGDDGAMLLSNNLRYSKNLKYLSLTYNCIGDVGICTLAKELKMCYKLELLLLYNNEIGDDGAKNLADGVKHCPGLRSLHLAQNRIGDEGAKGIATILEHCTHLDMLSLRHNLIGADGAKSLGDGLKHSSELENLYLSHNMIGDDGTKALAVGLQACSKLRSLALEHNQLGVDGARHLAGALNCCTSLKTLGFDYNPIGDEGARYLAKGLASCTNLRNVSLSCNQIGDEGATELADNLMSCSALSRLSLDMNQIGDDGATALASTLSKCEDLLKVTLKGNNIGNYGTEALAKGLASCCNLEILNLAHNMIGDVGAKALAKHLWKCNHLEELKLEGNRIGDERVQCLVEGLTRCQYLCELSLEENSISKRGKEILLETFEHFSVFTV